MENWPKWRVTILRGVARPKQAKLTLSFVRDVLRTKGHRVETAAIDDARWARAGPVRS